MSHEESSKIRMRELCEYIKEHKRLPSRKRNKRLYHIYKNYRGAFNKTNSVRIFDSLHDIIKEYNLESLFLTDGNEFRWSLASERAKEYIDTNGKLPKYIAPKVKGILGLSHTSKSEENGLLRLNRIIDYVLANGFTPHHKAEPKLFTSLMTFKSVKHGCKSGFHFDSYDDLCKERGVPDLLNIANREKYITNKIRNERKQKDVKNA